MEIVFDSKLLPADGGEPRFVVVCLHGKNIEDEALRLLAERWRPHLTDTLFALPVFKGTRAGDQGGPEAADIAAAAAVLETYLHQLRREYGVSNDRVAILSFAEGAAVALAHGLRQSEQLGAIICFSGDFQGELALPEQIESRPPVLLVHGENDPVVPPPVFMHNFGLLSQANAPVSVCFRPGVARQIEALGADSAMFFLKGVQATNTGRSFRKEKAGGDIAKSIKLVIWDLDETLWQGALDDEDAIVLYENRVEILRRLNRSGIVSAICSKNDFETARRKLQALGLWDEFVFPRIAFAPKGPAIQALIRDMQLKPEHCLFIDDNDINLAEAKAVLPKLHTLDAKSDACDAFLLELVERHAHVRKSRVEEYRSLQSRVVEGLSFDGSREGFLKSCDIRVAIASSSDLIDFAPRIEELINRTNQLNYLKTRVAPGSMVHFVSEASLREGFALFAWDKFGYHGLVGFIAADARSEKLLHMAFSCRIMHMGMENVLLHSAMQRFTALRMPEGIDVKPEIPAWITVDDFSDPAVRARIFSEESASTVAPCDVRIRFMANCQSGVFAHFSGLRDVAEVDSHPRIFVLSMVLNNSHRLQNFPPAVVHYVGTDFYSIFWPPETWGHLENGFYEHCAREFCAFLRSKGCRLLVVGNPSNVEADQPSLIRGVTRERMTSFTDVWRRLAQESDEIDFLDVDDFVGADRMVDCVHFRVDASRDVAKRIGDWYASLPAGLFGQQQKVAAAE